MRRKARAQGGRLESTWERFTVGLGIWHRAPSLTLGGMNETVVQRRRLISRERKVTQLVPPARTLSLLNFSNGCNSCSLLKYEEKKTSLEPSWKALQNEHKTYAVHIINFLKAIMLELENHSSLSSKRDHYAEYVRRTRKHRMTCFR